jgi:thiol:disulfide interchange protein
MIVKELLTALLIAILMVTGFLLLIRRSGTQYGKLWLFLIVFVATWAGGVWIRPFGPPVKGVYWLTFALAGIIAVGLIGLFTPQRPPHGRHETLEKLEQVKRSEELQQATTMTLGLLFWLVLSILVLAIVFRYVISA